MPYGQDLYATMAAAAGAELLATVDANEAAPLDSELLAEFASDASASAAALPRTSSPQVVGIEIVVNGQAMLLSDLEGWSVTRSLDQQLQVWQISIPLRDATGPLGSPFTAAGPPTGKKTVTINGLYATATGLHRVALVTGGISDSSSRSTNGGGHEETINGVDAGGRFDRKVVTLVLPAGHGLPRGRVVKRLAEQAGVTSTAISDGQPMAKELQVVDGAWLSIARELMETEGKAILWDRHGNLVDVATSDPAGESIAWTFDERDWSSDGGVTVAHKADVLTDVTVTTQQQLTTAPGTCDATLARTESAVRGPYTPAGSAYVQAPGGYTSRAVPGAQPDDGLISLSVSERLEKCKTVVWERDRRYAWFRAEAVRYRWNAGTSSLDRVACLTDDNTDEAAPAYQDDERFQLVDETETWHYYNATGMRPEEVGTDALALTPTFTSAFSEAVPAVTSRPDATGALVEDANAYCGWVTRVRAPYAPRVAVSSRATAGDDYEPIDDVGILGRGDGTSRPGEADATGEETFRTVQLECGRVSDEVGNGTITRETKARIGWGYKSCTPGAGLQRFADGRESLVPLGSAHAVEDLQLLDSTTTLYVTTGEATHKSIAAAVDALQGTSTSEVKSGLSGAGPALPRVEIADRIVYETPEEEAQFSTDAKRGDTRTLTARVISAALEIYHEKGQLKTESTWAETPEELEAIGWRLIRDSAAADVTGELAGCNYFVEPGQRQWWRARAIGLDCNAVRLRSVTWSAGAGGAYTTTMTGKAYGW